jgi:glucose/arabinose dehydrogenase
MLCLPSERKLEYHTATFEDDPVRFYSLLFVLLLALPACEPPAIRAELVADGFDRPVFVASAGGDASRLYVLEQVTGLIRVIEDGAVLSTPFLDIGDRVSSLGGERGLLSMAFHPGYAENGRFFVCYSDNEGATVIEAFVVSADPNAADRASGAIIMTIDQPFANHNGGMIAFSPNDGYLYIGLGDGGSGRDPLGHGQNLGTALGSLLRIDVDAATPYAIPDTNPFVGVEGAVEEIWAYGLRNPWRFSFDRVTGDLYIGDVGQSAREEIDFQRADSPGGENYGWAVAEGFACLDGAGECGSDPGFTAPIYDYNQPISRSLTGGYVYRGTGIPALQGTYFFADYVSNAVWSFRYLDGAITEFTDQSAALGIGGGIASFGEDASGELYVLSVGAGAVYRIVAAL